MVISSITFPIQVKGNVNQFEQKLLITLDKEGKILSSAIFQISTEDKTFLIDNQDAFFKNVYSNTIKEFSGDIYFFDLKFNFTEFKKFEGGKCKIQKRVSNSLNKKNARINECTNWYVVTTNTATGEVISEEYVGTTYGNGGGSSSSESGGFGPYLCPSSFRSTTESTFDNGLGHIFSLGTTNVKAGYNNIIVNFNIQVSTKNRIHEDYFPYLALMHLDIAMFGATKQGDYYYLDEKAMRVLISRATNNGALFADESLLQNNLLTVYLNQLNQAAGSYLASFGFVQGTFYEATPFSIEGTSSNQAQQINSLFQYWFSDCSN